MVSPGRSNQASRVSARRTESEDPFHAILRHAVGFVKALETGRIRYCSGGLARNSTAATVVTMDRIGTGQVGSKSGGGKGGDSEQYLDFSVLSLAPVWGACKALRIDCR